MLLARRQCPGVGLHTHYTSLPPPLSCRRHQDGVCRPQEAGGAGRPDRLPQGRDRQVEAGSRLPPPLPPRARVHCKLYFVSGAPPPRGWGAAVACCCSQRVKAPLDTRGDCGTGGAAERVPAGCSKLDAVMDLSLSGCVASGCAQQFLKLCCATLSSAVPAWRLPSAQGTAVLRGQDRHGAVERRHGPFKSLFAERRARGASPPSVRAPQPSPATAGPGQSPRLSAWSSRHSLKPLVSLELRERGQHVGSSLSGSSCRGR